MSEREKVVCPRNHFYDGNIYSSCPHCADGMESGKEAYQWSVPSDPVEEDKHTISKLITGKSLFGKKNKAVQEPPKAEPLKQDTPTMAMSDANKTERLEQVHTDDGSIRLEGTGSVAKSTSVSDEDMKESVQQPVWEKSLAKENLDECKTIGYFHTSGKEEPPVGYLICIAGEDYGRGFLLKSGNNSLGRSGEMDIVIMDAKVSRDKQISVIYEPHKREFYVKPSENGALSYCNGELLLGAQKIYSHDVLEVGDTKLMLIPVCSEKFSWEE